MNINAAPRVYTSNLVADSDLNMGQHNIKANAIFPRDNYLLSMLDYGEAFPQNVQEGDKVFKWGADSTTSYIYTYLNGAWDAGVKPQHMQDYYIADENRTVRFFNIIPSGGIIERSYSDNGLELQDCYLDGLIFGPDCYILGTFAVNVWVPFLEGAYSIDLYIFKIYFYGCSSSKLSELDVLGSTGVTLEFSSFNNVYTVNVASKCNSFVLRSRVSSFGSYSRIAFGFIYSPVV